jgi:DDE superfamily endonuclease/Helix-turn-helix of DDE superfamily endonuclease
MISYTLVAETPDIFRALTGLSQADFDALFADFQEAHAARLGEATHTKRGGRPRQRKAGAGHPFHHDLRDRLLLALVWLRVYPTYELLGWLFGLDKSNAWHNVQDVLATLEQMACFPLERPEARPQLTSRDDLFEAFPEVRLVVDATEQSFHRLKGWDNQKPFYSGKRKRHTIKAQLICTPGGRVGSVGPSVPGSVHDLTLLRQSGDVDGLAPQDGVMADLGYVGLAGDRPGLTVVLPHKASKDAPLSDEQKAYNRGLSRCRVVVENLLARLKVFQVLRQTFRSVFGRHAQVFRVAALLVDRCLAAARPEILSVALE